MVRLYEYQGKNLLKNIGVPIPQGEVVSRPKEAKDVAERLKKPVALKSQVWAGRRGKAGGIRFAETPEDAEKLSSEMLGKELHGLKVERLLVEEKLDIEKEYYVGVVVDSSRDVEAPVLMFTTEGGVDIEEIPEEKIQKMTVDVIRGVRVYDAYNLARRAGVQSKFLASIARCIKGVYERPANKCVAEFVGSSNLIEGKIVELQKAENLAVVDTPIGLITCYNIWNLSEGSRVLIAIRPEYIEVAAINEEGYRARVSRSAFMGEAIIYWLDISGLTLCFKTRPNIILPDEKEVCLKLKPEYCKMVKL